jgi:methyltransferase (TIGR00027 family)
MARTDNDTWDLATGVGATATGVAVGRALASRGPDPMINDPFAEPLVRAVGVDFFTRMASGQLDPAEVDGDAVFGMRRMVDMMGVRTRFFDDFFMQATDAGIRQAVILASGLDARAYRLSWPAGTTVYEIDQPQVIDFKTTTLAKLGASATADRRAVAIDLRHDWPTALRQAGFDPAQPTAWTAEGLLLFLPPEAQDRLLDNVTALSVAGSRFASENMPGSSELVVKMQERMRGLTESWRRYGFDLDMADLGYTGERHEVAEYLNAHGWDTVATSMAEVFAANGLSPHEDDETADLNARFGYLAATRVGDAGQC